MAIFYSLPYLGWRPVTSRDQQGESAEACVSSPTGVAVAAGAGRLVAHATGCVASITTVDLAARAAAAREMAATKAAAAAATKLAAEQAVARAAAARAAVAKRAVAMSDARIHRPPSPPPSPSDNLARPGSPGSPGSCLTQSRVKVAGDHELHGALVLARSKSDLKEPASAMCKKTAPVAGLVQSKSDLQQAAPASLCLPQSFFASPAPTPAAAGRKTRCISLTSMVNPDELVSKTRDDGRKTRLDMYLDDSGKAYVDAEGQVHMSPWTTQTQRAAISKRAQRLIEQEKIVSEAKRIKQQKGTEDAMVRSSVGNAADLASKKTLSMWGAIKEAFRNEHTLIGLVSPPDDEEALTPSQLIQLFFTAMMVDMMTACVFADTSEAGTGSGGRRSRGGGQGASGEEAGESAGIFDFSAVDIINTLKTGIISAAIVAVVLAICTYIFRWGNSMRRNGEQSTREIIMERCMATAKPIRMIILTLSGCMPFCGVFNRPASGSVAPATAPEPEQEDGAGSTGPVVSNAAERESAPGGDTASAPSASSLPLATLLSSDPPSIPASPSAKDADAHLKDAHPGGVLSAEPARLAASPVLPVVRRYRIAPAAPDASAPDTAPASTAALVPMTPKQLRTAGKQDLQDRLCCPITQQLMSDPVFTADGQTYERSAIESWLRVHDTSPLTGGVLEHKNLVPNFALRSVISELVAAWPELALQFGGSEAGAPLAGVGTDAEAKGDTDSADDLKALKDGNAAGNAATKVANFVRVRSVAMAAKGRRARKKADPVAFESALKVVEAQFLQETAAFLSPRAAREQAKKLVKKMAKREGHLNDFTVITLQAVLERTKREIRWRSRTEQNVRAGLAWIFNAAMYFIASVMVLAYGVEALGPDVMGPTIRAWLFALIQVFLIVEPLQVVIVATMPFCINEDTRVGRCCRRTQWCYNEFFAP